MDDLSRIGADVGIDLEQLRDMCSKEAQPFGGTVPPRPEFVIQLREAREEWRRRQKQQDRKF